jgi:hypothetical protein
LLLAIISVSQPVIRVTLRAREESRNVLTNKHVVHYFQCKKNHDEDVKICAAVCMEQLTPSCVYKF